MRFAVNKLIKIPINKLVGGPMNYGLLGYFCIAVNVVMFSSGDN